MMRRIFVLVLVTILGISFINGCKKKSGEPETTVIKSDAEYKAEAEKQINPENMDDELNKLEKQLEQEISSEE